MEYTFKFIDRDEYIYSEPDDTLADLIERERDKFPKKFRILDSNDQEICQYTTLHELEETTFWVIQVCQDRKCIKYGYSEEICKYFEWSRSNGHDMCIQEYIESDQLTYDSSHYGALHYGRFPPELITQKYIESALSTSKNTLRFFPQTDQNLFYYIRNFSKEIIPDVVLSPKFNLLRFMFVPKLFELTSFGLLGDLLIDKFPYEYVNKRNPYAKPEQLLRAYESNPKRFISNFLISFKLDRVDLLKIIKYNPKLILRLPNSKMTWDFLVDIVKINPDYLKYIKKEVIDSLSPKGCTDIFKINQEYRMDFNFSANAKFNESVILTERFKPNYSQYTWDQLYLTVKTNGLLLLEYVDYMLNINPYIYMEWMGFEYEHLYRPPGSVSYEQMKQLIKEAEYLPETWPVIGRYDPLHPLKMTIHDTDKIFFGESPTRLAEVLKPFFENLIKGVNILSASNTPIKGPIVDIIGLFNVSNFKEIPKCLSFVPEKIPELIQYDPSFISLTKDEEIIKNFIRNDPRIPRSPFSVIPDDVFEIAIHKYEWKLLRNITLNQLNEIWDRLGKKQI